MKIAVVGCGGIGSHLVHMLVNTIGEEDSIVVFDGDSYEEGNLKRQLFDKSKIGTNKAIVMERMYCHLCDIEAVPRFLEHSESLSSFDWIFCCPDNNMARLISLEASIEYHIPCIVSGNEKTSANAVIQHPLITNWPTHCVTHIHPEYMKIAPRIAANSCQQAIIENPQTIAANNMAACMSIWLFIAWRDNAIEDVEFLEDHFPFEYSCGKTFIKKTTLSEAMK